MTIILLGLIISSCKSQSTIIKGQAICYDSPPEFSNDIPVYLRLNDTSYMIARTNSNGEYSFKLNKNKGTAIICIEAVRLGESGQKKNYGYRTCSQTRTLTLKGDTIKVEKFYLNSHTVFDYAPQSVLFKFNSLVTLREKNIVPFTDLPADSAITSMITLLNDNPTIVLQLNGHCDLRENNPEQISQQRAQMVADMLIKKGIPKGRLVSKGFANEQPIISNNVIANAKQSEKESLYQMNRRVTLSIASFDYKDGK